MHAGAIGRLHQGKIMGAYLTNLVIAENVPPAKQPTSSAVDQLSMFFAIGSVTLSVVLLHRTTDRDLVHHFGH